MMAARYPHLTNLLKVMALNNDMEMLPAKQRVWPSDAICLESQAAKLTPEQKETFACGPWLSDSLRLRDELELHELDRFINDAFDGDQMRHFFVVD